MKISRAIKTTAAGALSALALTLSPRAKADLQVFPTRILLTDTEKSAQISVRHKGTKTMRYRIEAVYYKMKEDGAMELVSDAATADRSAVSHFRFSPRQVTLEPNIEQVVRIMARVPAGLEEGEYRAHLYFEGIDEGDEKTMPVTTSTGAQMMLKARMAVAVPVIVRKGQAELKLELKDLKIVKAADGRMSYTVEVSRAGKRFLYGDFLVFHKPDGAKEETLVSQANGVSSYNDRRVVSFPLSVPSVGPGTLRAEVRATTAEGGQVLATASAKIDEKGASLAPASR